jgi:recombination endonuclease VII
LLTREQEIERRLAEQAGKPPERRYERCHIELILDGDPSVGRMSLFHQHRCAVCGLRPVDGHLVDDHCHETGQIRGWLCRSCNVREGVSHDPLFIRYRRLHPAAILDVYELYTGIGWNDGWSLVEHGRDAFRFGPRPFTPWPAWNRESARVVGQ